MNLIADEYKLKQDSEASLLIKKIKEGNYGQANIYYNFPFYRGETKDELVSAHVLFVSQSFGVIFFRCLSSENDYNKIEKSNLDELV